MDKPFDWRGFAVAMFAVAVVLVILGVFAVGIIGRATDVGCVGGCLDRNDLAMQTNMALAAWAVALVSAVSLVVGAVSLYFLRANLRETRSIGEAQTRAYLVVMEATMERGDDAQDWKVKFKFRNSGQTPGVTLMTDIQVWAETRLETGWRRTATPGRREVRTRSDTASQDEKNATHEFSIEALRGPQGVDGTTRLRAAIDIRYRDIFGARHSTASSYYLDVSLFTEPPFNGSLPLMRSLDDYT